MRFFRVVNFEKFQHYKDRAPPWIKLHAGVLDDYAFARLQDASKAHLMLIWLLASRSSNKLPWDSEWISGRLGAVVPVDLDELAGAGFIEEIQELRTPEQNASNALAKRSSETEGETEREAEKSSVPIGTGAKAPDVASLVFGRGLAWLQQNTGKSEDSCRPLLGKWRKQYGDEALIAVLGAAQREAPLDAIAWIERAFQNRTPAKPARPDWN